MRTAREWRAHHSEHIWEFEHVLVDEEQYHTWREVLLHMGLVFFLVQFVFDIVALELLWTRT